MNNSVAFWDGLAGRLERSRRFAKHGIVVPVPRARYICKTPRTALDYALQARVRRFLRGDIRTQPRLYQHGRRNGLNLNRQASVPRLAYRAMADQWTEKLWCSICGKTGMASLSQHEDAETPIVLSVPSGFKVVNDQCGPNFFCEICDRPVVP